MALVMHPLRAATDGVAAPELDGASSAAVGASDGATVAADTPGVTAAALGRGGSPQAGERPATLDLDYTLDRPSGPGACGDVTDWWFTVTDNCAVAPPAPPPAAFAFAYLAPAGGGLDVAVVAPVAPPLEVTPVPLPGAAGLFALGCVALGVARWWRR